MYIIIPLYDHDSKTWGQRAFLTKKDYVDFLWSVFKEPGLYDFDETAFIFNEQARKFQKNGYYCTAPFKSKDFIEFWDTEKEKCRKGVIYTHKGKVWFLTRYYYMWLNFLPIYDKEEKKFGFAKVRDAQYHMALYEEIAEMSSKHAAILKKRQIASSYFHMGRVINLYWFEEGAVNKIAGSLKDYINEKGSWRFLEEYRNFLNTHTAWYRPSTPDKVLNWEQKIEITAEGRKKDVGLKSVVIGLVLEKDPTNGVGGPCAFFFHEEAGIAPKMNETLEYLLPALKSGMEYTGMFAVAGSVGDLDQCEPLKELIYNPASKDVLAVPTTWTNPQRELKEFGLFIPEQWSMLPCIDEYGNSLVEDAIKMILEEREQWKKDLKPEDYQLRISQKPMYIEEAFAYRNVSKFPQHLITNQIRRIEDKTYYYEHLELYRDDQGKVTAKESRKLPISEFPLSPKAPNKEGCLVVWERPIPNAEWGTYYASIDPVGEGRSTTSDSLCSIIVYRNTQEIKRLKKDGTAEHVIEPGRIVASWCGRYDDLNKTHELLELIIEWYGAWTIVENNVSLFIQHMIHKRKQKYLVPKSQILFLKELNANNNVYQEYGWKNVGTIFKSDLLSYGIEFLKEVIDIETKPDGEIVKQTYGVERVPDIMLLKEMQAYHEGLNVDRLVAYCALIAFVRVQESNRGYTRRVEKEDDSLVKKEKITKLNMTPFRNIGRSNKIPRRTFKNFK
jgi:hypothetical protein